ncbi:MAG: hypothetical protein J3R72DRAFT_442816 [Linnemannia gamsii]|nr:MAG: hypothetical protein J3R72DRAFT_442816 [Linnemannia gamsii]
MDSPLQLPEILLYIAPYLTHQDLVVCLTVCRQWNQSFTPLIFHTITAQEDWSTSKDSPSLSSLIKNAHSVRSLTLKTTVGLAPFLEKCTRLKTLVVHGDIFSKQQEDIWIELTSLVRHNPLIERIFLGFQRLHSPSAAFLHALAEACPSLKRYESSQGKYEDQEQVEALMKVLQQIRSVSTRYECFTNIPIDTTRTFPHMRELTLKDAKGLSTQSQVDFVSHCPNLEHLKWTVCRDTFFPVQQFCERVPAACPNLRKLQMDGCGIPYPSDLSRIVNSLTQLELLAFCGTAIFPRTFRSMERHFRTLRSLDVVDCFSVKSWMVQATLEGCPLLETLKVPYLVMSDVEIGKPWASLRLKQLHVHFRPTAVCGQDYITQHKATFRALGRLTELQVLDTSTFDPKGPTGLQYRLDLGMASLETLGKLSALSVINTRQDIEDEELSWIMSHWPLLTKLEGTFHHDWEQHELVTKELRARGIEVPDQREPDLDCDIKPWAFDHSNDKEPEDEEMGEYNEYDDEGDDDGYLYYYSENEGEDDESTGDVTDL